MRWLSMSLPMSNYRVVSFKAKSKLMRLEQRKALTTKSHETRHTNWRWSFVSFRVLSWIIFFRY